MTPYDATNSVFKLTTNEEYRIYAMLRAHSSKVATLHGHPLNNWCYKLYSHRNYVLYSNQMCSGGNHSVVIADMGQANCRDAIHVWQPCHEVRLGQDN